ncbi:hypothetical protein BaRGS_00039246, partial [Batillaria attramentaria]
MRHSSFLVMVMLVLLVQQVTFGKKKGGGDSGTCKIAVTLCLPIESPPQCPPGSQCSSNADSFKIASPTTLSVGLAKDLKKNVEQKILHASLVEGQDADCASTGQLCCSNGCGNVCTDPVYSITCANVKCAGGPCVDTGNGPKCQNNGQTGCSSDSDCNGNKECCNGVCSPNCSPCDSVTCLAGDETCVETPEPHCECTSSVYNCLVSPCSVTPCDNHPAAEC